MKINIKLTNILKDSIYPFQCNKNAGNTLKQSYYLMFSSYILVKNNKKTFQNILNWNNDQYYQFLYNNLLVCDQIYMLTQTYLKYSQESTLFNNILIEIESLYLSLFTEEHLFKDSILMYKYYNIIFDLFKVYNNYKKFYTKEVDLGLAKEDKFLKRYEATIANTKALYLENRKNGL